MCGSMSRAPMRGRIEQDVRIALLQPVGARELAGQIGPEELCIGDAVALGIGARALDQCRLALHTHDTARAPSQCQREVAQTAIQIEHLRLGGQFQQLRGGRHQRAVCFGIDLDEIRRPEFQLKIGLGQRVRQSRRRLGQRPHAIQTTALQEYPNPVLALEFAQPGAILLGRSLQYAQYQRRGGIGNCDFDLRQLFADRELPDQLRQRRNQAIDGRREHFAAREAGHQIAAALAESHQHPPLARHVFDAQPRAPPVAPGAALNGLQPAHRRHPAQAFEALGQLQLLELQLRSVVEVLQRAAAADIEVRAARNYALSRRRENLLEMRLVVLPVAARTAKTNRLPRQSPGDESGLGLMDYALPLLAQGRDHAGFALAMDDGRAPAHAAVSQALRNCA
jgi:hypothetical protein